MKPFHLLALLIGAIPGSCLVAQVPDLDRLQETHRTSVARAVKPLTQTYVKELEKLRDNYTRAGKLEAASLVQAEITEVTRSEELTATAAAPTPPAGNDVIIPANDMDAHKLPPLKRGSVITLSYVDGKWKNDGAIASEVPDAEASVRGEAIRLAISTASYNDKPGRVLAVVPAGTASKPFSYTLTADHSRLVLRINESGEKFSDNPGSVTYKVSIVPK
jgi:hypothetical protein